MLSLIDRLMPTAMPHLSESAVENKENRLQIDSSIIDQTEQFRASLKHFLRNRG